MCNNHLTVLVSLCNVLLSEKEKKRQKVSKLLTLRLCLSYSDIEWSHLISISKGLQENQKNLQKPRGSALLLATKHLKKERGVGVAREWQSVIREAGKATRGETDRRAGKWSVFCLISKTCLILTKVGFSGKKGFFVVGGGPSGELTTGKWGLQKARGGNRNSCSFWWITGEYCPCHFPVVLTALWRKVG